MATEEIRIGFVPLTDSAPLIVAKEKGLFEKHGLNVTLSRENSWSQIRDKLTAGAIDAAHMLAPMVPASWLGETPFTEKFVTALTLNLNGNAITVSNELYDRLLEADRDAMLERPITARAIRKVIAQRIERGEEPLTIGAVFPFSSHNYAVRYWLGAEGINPDRDVRMVVAPPPFMVEQLEKGIVDAFCVGEPWNSMAEYRGLGRSIVTSAEIWRNTPEKVLGVRETWAVENPEIHHALLCAVLEALVMLDKPSVRQEALSLLTQPGYLNVPVAVLAPALTGKGILQSRRSLVESDDFLIFHHYAANFPWRSHALWYLTQMTRWGQVQSPVNLGEIARSAYLTGTYRRVAETLDVVYPTTDYKMEGNNDRAWLLPDASEALVMPRSSFIDGGTFNPNNIASYIERFVRHNMRLDPGALVSDIE